MGYWPYNILFKKYKADCTVFFETGTYKGDSVQDAYDLGFKRIISIEINKDFYNHFGLDLKATLRAALTNIKNIGSQKRLIGASTITQQVAKNFLLTSEVSFDRKIKEAILSIRIERAFSKRIG